MDNNLVTTSLVNKINNITNYLEKFDDIFIKIIENPEKSPNVINSVAEITELYMFIRSEHGSLILLLDELKNEIKSNNPDKVSDGLINKLYTLSTFFSTLESVSSVISNIDFQYKKIATKYPKFINKKTITLILVVNNENDNFKKIIEKLQEINPENVYKVITTTDDNINIKDIGIDSDLKLNITKFPTLFMINNNIITDICLKENDTIEKIQKLIS
jgi:hypothetical protein